MAVAVESRLGELAKSEGLGVVVDVLMDALMALLSISELGCNGGQRKLNLRAPRCIFFLKGGWLYLGAIWVSL
jgi:hypothetical protein